MMRLSPFRPGASQNENVAAMLSWVALTAVAGIYYHIKEVRFGPEPEVVPFVFGIALLCGFLCWLRLYKGRDLRTRLA
jgi:hypothetical protein